MTNFFHKKNFSFRSCPSLFPLGGEEHYLLSLSLSPSLLPPNNVLLSPHAIIHSVNGGCGEKKGRRKTALEKLERKKGEICAGTEGDKCQEADKITFFPSLSGLLIPPPSPTRFEGGGGGGGGGGRGGRGGGGGGGGGGRIEGGGRPNHQWWYAKWNLSWNTYALHTHFRTFGTDL